MLPGTRPLLRLASIRTSIKPPAPIAPIPLRKLSGVPALLHNARLFALPPPRRQAAAYSTKQPLSPSQDEVKKFEKEMAGKKIEARPDEVSSESTTRHVFEASPAGSADADKDMTEDIKRDLGTIKDTFALTSVPREPYALGLAGTLPYLATSLSTVFLSWNLSTEWPTSSSILNSIMLSHETAERFLHIVEPLQLGYGAVIISFLGAIHWGMEWAEKTPSRDRSRFRYAVGVIAPAIAWPTLLMPVEYALTAQFAAFTFLYFADARATTYGWTPPWYGTYRFVLTFVVGSAIFISLVSRTKIGDKSTRLGGARLAEGFHNPAGDSEQVFSENYSESGWARKEAEEKKRIKKEKKEEEKRRKEEEKKEKEKKGDKGEKKDDKKEDVVKDKKEEDNDSKDQKDSDGDKKGDDKKDNKDNSSK